MKQDGKLLQSYSSRFILTLRTRSDRDAEILERPMRGDLEEEEKERGGTKSRVKAPSSNPVERPGRID